MYYLLDRFGAKNPCRWVGEYPFLENVEWNSGYRIVKQVPVPLRLDLEPLDPDASDNGPEMPEYFKGRIPLLRSDLVEAMVTAGCNNLDLYEVVVRDPDNGVEYDNYKAVNIIGAIAVADLEKSTATVHHGGAIVDVDFDSLIVKHSRTRGALIFRLAESINGILVHEKLRDKLIANGFIKLEFLDPKECAL